MVENQYNSINDSLKSRREQIQRVVDERKEIRRRSAEEEQKVQALQAITKALDNINRNNLLISEVFQ